MKKILTIIILTTLTICVVAQNPRQRPPRGSERSVVSTERGIDDPRAHAILSDVRKHLKSFRSLKIEFTFLMENRNERTSESQKGTILIRGNRYRMDFMGQTMISDGRTAWSFNREANEVVISTADPKDMETLNPLALLENYEKNFRAKLIREDRDRGVAVMIIDLQPFENRSFHKVRVITDKDKNTIVATEIHEKNGTTMTFRVDRMQTNVPAPDSEFRFDVSKHQGIEVIDMR